MLDDLFELDALTKLGGQVLAAGVPGRLRASSSSSSRTRREPVFSLDPAQGALLTGLLVVATVNAVNFVDGLDGLAGGRRRRSGRSPSSSSATSLTRSTAPPGATTAALLSIALAGVCVGFLVHNFHPARLFMGDSGSMLIGLVLSASAVTLYGPVLAPRS